MAPNCPADLEQRATVHGTAVAIGGRGVLLRGPSRCGKSDLALRLIDAGARLIADDQVTLRRDSDTLDASAPAAIAGKLEVRGIGIVDVDVAAHAPLSLVVDLVAPNAVERMPETLHAHYLDVAVPLIRIAPFEASAAAKVRLGAAAATAAILARHE